VNLKQQQHVETVPREAPPPITSSPPVQAAAAVSHSGPDGANADQPLTAEAELLVGIGFDPLRARSFAARLPAAEVRARVAWANARKKTAAEPERFNRVGFFVKMHKEDAPIPEEFLRSKPRRSDVCMKAHFDGETGCDPLRPGETSTPPTPEQILERRQQVKELIACLNAGRRYDPDNPNGHSASH
jgi:hypothetical protein